MFNSDFDLDAKERIQRNQWKAERHQRRDESLRETLAIHAADVRAGCFRNMKPHRTPTLPWDGVKNSQITPIGR